MPRAFQGNPRPRLRLHGLRRMRHHLGVQQRGTIAEECLMRDRAYRLRIQRAFHRRRSEMLPAPVQHRFHRFHRHHAMVFAMHPAARRQPRLRRAPQRKQRRDLRKAEQQQQRDGDRPSHRRRFAYANTDALPCRVKTSPSPAALSQHNRSVPLRGALFRRERHGTCRGRSGTSDRIANAPVCVTYSTP